MKTADGKQVPRFDETQCKLLIRFDDSVADKDSEFESGWSQFLYSTNLLQFIDASLFITENGCNGNIYNWITLANLETEETIPQCSTETQIGWDNIISEELFDPDAISYAHTLKASGCPVPSTVGFEVDGIVVAEMVWEDLKVAILLSEQAEHREMLENEGWLVFDLGSTKAIDAIKGV